MPENVKNGDEISTQVTEKPGYVESKLELAGELGEIFAPGFGPGSLDDTIRSRAIATLRRR